MSEKFALGQVCTTVGIEAKVPIEQVLAAIQRHVNGDWGDVCSEDAAQNDWALENEARLLSSYKAADGTTFWIITEADRSSTTVLLPDEY